MAKGIKNNIDSLKCIWMPAYDVGEKLCDRKFDCDNCEFDRQMKESREPGDFKEFYLNPDYNLLEETIQKLSILKTISYPPNYRFTNSLVLKKFLGATYFAGFNPILNILFDNITSTEIFGQGTVYKRGDSLFGIKGDWGNVVISAPFEFTFESEIITAEPSSAGKWLGFIKSSEEKIKPSCLVREEYLNSIDNVCGQLKNYMEKFVTVGTTMYDGGERLKYIYQIIGRENYLKILSAIIS